MIALGGGLAAGWRQSSKHPRRWFLTVFGVILLKFLRRT
jgi:hypothetical protein